MTEGLPTLTLTVGLPRSGKSTWARAQGHPIVCPDEIRLALHGKPFIADAEPFVWAIAKVMVAALFGAGHRHVILDACNTTGKRRAEWNCDPRWVVDYQIFAVPKEVCEERARATGREDILPAIERMAEQWEYPATHGECALSSPPPRDGSALPVVNTIDPTGTKVPGVVRW